MLKSGKFWIGMAVSVLFLYIAFRGIDFGALVSVISNVSLPWIAVGIGLYIVNLIVRAMRWQYIFKHVKKVSLWSMTGATLVGYFANNVLPMRLGEVARAVYVGRKEECDGSACLGTIAVERVFDVLMAVLVLALTFVIFPFPDEMVGEWNRYFLMAGEGLVMVAFVGLAVMFIMVRRRDWTLRTLDRVLGFLPEKARKTVGKMTRNFIDGLTILGSPLDVLVLFIFTALVYLTNLWPIWATGMAFHVPGFELNFTDQLFLLTAGAVAAAIPASPGFVGTFHWVTKRAVVIILTVKYATGGIAATGIPPEAFEEWGLSLAVLIHGLYIMTTTTAGAIILSMSGISFTQLRNEVKEEVAEVGKK